MGKLSRIAACLSGLLLGSTPSAQAAENAFQFSFLAPDGALLPLKQYQGNLLLVVNTASECGFTPQYEGLEKLYQTYKARGLVVLAVPSNDFGAQEPGTTEEIQHFAQDKYQVTFPVVQKEAVKGSAAHPFYRWVAKQAGPIGAPKWNFHKYLIGPDGRLIDWYASTTAPMSDKLRKAIEANLPR